MARRIIDWAGIEAAWREAPGSVREIARRFGVSHSAILRRARTGAWEARAGAAPRRPPAGAGTVAVAGGGLPARERVVGGHRAVVARGAVLTLQLLDELLAASAGIGEVEALIAAAAQDEAGRAALERAMSLPKRTAALRDLAAAARLWIVLERQAWGLDGKGQDGKAGDDPDLPDPAAALRLLDGEQRAQLRRIAEVLAVRPPGDPAGA
ncbi:hypothetical protein OPKNFCMD_5159 [Methylobacterium crusticola]|uniref:Uncharacterized protein n=1 Tax=Methylobacterium crusticola TaxID=1697972 RepID=A0ABQ4R4K5_9HYPH|nr:hypothetical protein [Methylobacterium crusticola]GJD52394.1 hypothetical protein OPKNFCMD_5159 [Methylobacterium crusticola]